MFTINNFTMERYMFRPVITRFRVSYNVYEAIDEDQSNGSTQVTWVLKCTFKTRKAAREYVQELNAYGEKK